MDLQYTILVQLGTRNQVQRAAQLFKRGSTSIPDDNSGSLTFADWRNADIWLTSFPAMTQVPDNELLLSEYLGHGIIHLYKSDEATEAKNVPDDECTTIPGDDTMMTVLFVPTYFTVHDLLHFYIGDDIVNNQVSYFRILRNKQNNFGYNFTLLIKFKDPLMAKQFREEFNGKRFSKVDSETCHVVPIKEIIFKKAIFNSSDQTQFPYLLTDPFTTHQNKAPVELPTCPVCLERMDPATTGLITIPCQHTFHCQCLDKWKNSKCPVCRYSSLRLSRNSLLKQARGSAHCSNCNTTDNLWICLICGNVGCGRYNAKHAIQHYEDTSHCFAMDLQTQRVWDYAGDNYVHRLVQNETDGKLVEVGSELPLVSGSGSGSHELGANTHTENKEEGHRVTTFLRNKEYHLEYVQVLVSQLESQREYYEMKLQQMELAAAHNNRLETLEKDLEKLKLQAEGQQNTLKQTNIQLQKQLDEERMLVRGLQENLDYLTEKSEKDEREKETLEKEKQELEEQVKDLMFYLDSQEKFKDADESVKEGTIVVQQNPLSKKTGKRKAKKKK